MSSDTQNNNHGAAPYRIPPCGTNPPYRRSEPDVRVPSLQTFGANRMFGFLPVHSVQNPNPKPTFGFKANQGKSKEIKPK